MRHVKFMRPTQKQSPVICPDCDRTGDVEKEVQKELMELTASERLVKARKYEIHRNPHGVAEKLVSTHSEDRIDIL